MFLSKTFAVGAQKYRLIETVLLSPHTICFGREISELILVTRYFTLRFDVILPSFYSRLLRTTPNVAVLIYLDRNVPHIDWVLLRISILGCSNTTCNLYLG